MVEMLPEKTSSDPAENLQLRGSVIHGLQQNLMHGGRSLQMIPDTIKLIVAKDTWRKWVNKVTGRVEEFASFEEFVREPLPDGLGAEIRTLKHLCQDDKTALDAIDRATVGGRGNPTGANQYTERGNDKNLNNCSPRTSPGGESAQQAIHALRDKRPDLHAAVLKGDIKPHAAMLAAGLRRKRISVYVDDPATAARSIKRASSPGYIEELIKELQRD